MPTSKAQQRATMKYEKINYDKIVFRVSKGKKDLIDAHAKSIGLSRNAYLNKLIDDDMNK